MKKYDVIIIGAGIAGMTAGIYAVRAGKSVLILESTVQGGQIINTLNIENWPGDLGVSGADLSQKIYAQATKLGVQFEFEEVVAIKDATGPAAAFPPFSSSSMGGPQAASPVGSFNGFTIQTDEAEYACQNVILAVGTEPRKLSEKQAKDAGKRPISYCATCDGALYKGKPVVVVGSGNTAKHEMKYLENIASKVYHIHHDDPIPKDAEAVFVAIGRVPNTEFLRGFVDLDSDGYIIAGEDCKTSREGVFAIGDCRTKKVRQLVTAASDGATAISAL